MIKNPRLYILTAVVIGFLVSYPQLSSSAAAKPKYVRLIIHEHRLHFEEAYCLDQHLKEHLYARLVDKELTDRGFTAFSVDAVSAIDKIIIGVEHWGGSEERASIAQAAADGIKKRPPAHLIEQERALVIYEDSLLAKAPLLGASVTSALLRATPTLSLSCSAEQQRLASDDISGWSPDEYEIFEYRGNGQYSRLSSPQGGISTFPNAWDGLQFPLVEASTVSAGLAPNILFVGYKGEAELLSTTKLLASIYDAIAGSELGPNDVRPFGKAGFLISGEYRVLGVVQEKIRTAFSSTNNSPLDFKNLQIAMKSICASRTEKQEQNVELFDEKIAHTYFEYAAQGQSCREDAHLARATADLSIVINLIYVAEPDPAPPSYSGQMSLNLCIPQKEFVREDLSVAAYALRQHLRYDLGLALNVKFLRIEGNCVKGFVFAPTTNAGALDRSFINFDPRNEEYRRRYSSSKNIYHCSKCNIEKCLKNNDASKDYTPKIYVVGVP